MNRKASAILLLIAVLLYLLKPVMPFVEYSIFKDYIAQNLCINREKPRSCCEGKCYLKKQVEKNAEDEAPSTASHKDKKNSRSETKEFLAVFEFSPLLLVAEIELSSEQIWFYEAFRFSGVFVPPQSIC